MEFSAKSWLQLLERAEIQRVYREQGLSKANTDYLKLGQILGADGLLLLQTTTEGTNQFLNVRSIENTVNPCTVILRGIALACSFLIRTNKREEWMFFRELFRIFFTGES